MNENKLIKLEKETVYTEDQKKLVKDYSYLNTLALEHQMVFVGDSIIKFWPQELLAPLSGRLLKSIYLRGIGGDTSNRLLERIETNVCALNPDGVFMIIGTNDLRFKFPEDYTISNIRSIVETIRLHCPNTKIFISSLLPVNKNVDRNMVGVRKNKKIIALNAAIAELAREMDFTFIDLFPEVLDENGDFASNYTYDGLHPTVTCYHRLSEIVTEKIKLNDLDFSL